MKAEKVFAACVNTLQLSKPPGLWLNKNPAPVVSDDPVVNLIARSPVECSDLEEEEVGASEHAPRYQVIQRQRQGGFGSVAQRPELRRLGKPETPS